MILIRCKEDKEFDFAQSNLIDMGNKISLLSAPFPVILIIHDSNIYWIPENLFQNEYLNILDINSFLRSQKLQKISRLNGK